MAQVKAIATCFVENGLRQPGDVFEYNGPPNRHLERIDRDGDGSDPEPPDADRPATRRRVRAAKQDATATT